MSFKHPDTQLYGQPRPKHEPKTTLKSSTSHSFAAALSSLIAAPNNTAISSSSTKGRSATNRKDDIFTTHNKGAKKRAAADDAADKEYTSATGMKHKRDIGGVDHDTLHRSKRKMQEKARLYSAMKRGDYVPSSRGGGINAEESGSLVDFDRKWAESHAADNAEEEENSDSDESTEDSEQETVEYVDEFGRTRTGTKAEAEKEKRRQRIAAHAELELAEMSARPSMPEGIILGDAIQSAAFNPDNAVERAMADLAAKRDRSATPPEATHYDATKEVRSKGVGFYQFSKDKETRQQEFADLEQEREETLRREQERNDRKQKKLEELEERRRKIREKRSQKQVDGFFKSLNDDLANKDTDD